MKLQSVGWFAPFKKLRRKWVEVPVTRLDCKRIKTTELLEYSDEDLIKLWRAAREDITTGEQFSHRGWYHTLYADSMQGKRVLDVGSGFGFDGVTFAEHGAAVTFVDIVDSNLKVIERLCDILGLSNAEFLLMESLETLAGLPESFDVIMAMGSLHHAPRSVIEPEVRELLKHLRVGGRWLQVAYPKTRWEREGSMPFKRWGAKTDGEGTPWAEWYDLPKLLDLMKPAKFEIVMNQEFHNADFIWFDLIFRGLEG